MSKKISEIFPQEFFAYFLIFAAVVLRLIPHPPNFAPIGALALFGGTYLNKKEGLIITILAMLISDLFLGFHTTMPFVYGAFFLIWLLGKWLQTRKTLANLIGASLFSSVLFFIITNFGAWLAINWYPKNLEGLMTAYLAGIPFFRNTLTGDLFYVVILFGAYETVSWFYQKINLIEKVKNA